MLKVFIVDDEMPSRAELRYLLEQYADVQVVGEAGSGREALERLQDAELDAVFLDIHLHDSDGVEVANELLTTLAKPPIIIFASAYDAHAVRAFELEAVDYIVKPFSEQRLDKTVCRLRKYKAKLATAVEPAVGIEQRIASLLQNMLQDQPPRRIPVEKNGKIMLIDADEIVYATVEGRYATIFTDQQQYFTSFTLQELESRLPMPHFIRTHRAYIVNLNKTVELVPWFKGTVHLVMEDQRNSEVPVSRNAVKEVKKRLGF